jgi:hypothetical protein
MIDESLDPRPCLDRCLAELSASCDLPGATDLLAAVWDERSNPWTHLADVRHWLERASSGP